MKFSKILLDDIERQIDKKICFDSVLEKLRNAERIGIWGTGLAGTMIFEALERLHINVDFFTDNNLQSLEKFNSKGKRLLKNIQDRKSVV